MSVATALGEPQFAPARIPEFAVRCVPPERLASVTTLHHASERAVASPVRLTRRGVLVLGAAVAGLAAALMVGAWVSAPGSASGTSRAIAPDTVTVRSGDSLWSIAVRVSPRRDPRAEVGDLQRVNHLRGTALVPGQVLRTH